MEAIQSEFLQWNPTLKYDFEGLQILCHPDKMLEKEKYTMAVYFRSQKSLDKFFRDGACLFREHYHPLPY
jgi:hypothetical protein